MVEKGYVVDDSGGVVKIYPGRRKDQAITPVSGCSAVARGTESDTRVPCGITAVISRLPPMESIRYFIPASPWAPGLKAGRPTRLPHRLRASAGIRHRNRAAQGARCVRPHAWRYWSAPPARRETRRLPRRSDISGSPFGKADLQGNSRLVAHLVSVPSQCLEQPHVVQQRRSQVFDDASLQFDACDQGRLDSLPPRLDVFPRHVDPLRQLRKVHPDRHQQPAQLVMQFAGQLGLFALPHQQQVLRQFRQLAGAAPGFPP